MSKTIKKFDNNKKISNSKISNSKISNSKNENIKKESKNIIQKIINEDNVSELEKIIDRFYDEYLDDHIFNNTLSSKSSIFLINNYFNKHFESFKKLAESKNYQEKILGKNRLVEIFICAIKYKIKNIITSTAEILLIEEIFTSPYFSRLDFKDQELIFSLYNLTDEKLKNSVHNMIISSKPIGDNWGHVICPYCKKNVYYRGYKKPLINFSETKNIKNNQNIKNSQNIPFNDSQVVCTGCKKLFNFWNSSVLYSVDTLIRFKLINELEFIQMTYRRGYGKIRRNIVLSIMLAISIEKYLELENVKTENKEYHWSIENLNSFIQTCLDNGAKLEYSMIWLFNNSYSYSDVKRGINTNISYDRGAINPLMNQQAKIASIILYLLNQQFLTIDQFFKIFDSFYDYTSHSISTIYIQNEILIYLMIYSLLETDNKYDITDQLYKYIKNKSRGFLNKLEDFYDYGMKKNKINYKERNISSDDIFEEIFISLLYNDYHLMLKNDFLRTNKSLNNEKLIYLWKLIIDSYDRDNDIIPFDASFFDPISIKSSITPSSFYVFPSINKYIQYHRQKNIIFDMNFYKNFILNFIPMINRILLKPFSKLTYKEENELKFLDQFVGLDKLYVALRLFQSNISLNSIVEPIDHPEVVQFYINFEKNLKKRFQKFRSLSNIHWIANRLFMYDEIEYIRYFQHPDSYDYYKYINDLKINKGVVL